MTGVVDWSSRPEPWRSIGPEFREECEAIATGAARPSPALLLKQRREGLGLTQLQLSQIAKMHPQTVSRAECGYSGEITIKRLDEALDLYEQAREAAP